MLKQAVILAGGRGTRLGALTHDTPKPLLPVAGRPFLEHLIWNLKRHGIDRVVFALGYRAQSIEAHFGDGGRWGIRCDYSVEGEPLGTGGALRLASATLDEHFLVINGDTLFDLNYLDLATLLKPGTAAVALRAVPDVERYGRVLLDGSSITAFGEKVGRGPGLINGGVYVMRREILDFLPLGASSLERDLFPRLASEGRLQGRAYDEYFVDIGLPESLAAAQKRLPEWRRKPMVLLDRDGVLNDDLGYVHEPANFRWTRGAPEAVKWLNDRGYLVIVVTNQAGIARGYYSEADFLRFCGWISEQLGQWGAHLDATYYCPHHPKHGQGAYRRSCDCRKPAPGMVQRALRDWGAEPTRSFLVGDRDTDLLAASRSGLRGVRFQGGDLLQVVQDTVAEISHGPLDALLGPQLYPQDSKEGVRDECERDLRTK